MLAWWEGECLSPHPHPPMGASCPAVALAHPLPADQSVSAAPHPAQPSHLHPLATGQDCRPLCLCLWLSGQRWLLHGGPGVAQGQDRAGLGGRLAGSADLLAVFLWCRPCLRAHSQGLANVTQGEIAISFLANQDSFFLANADIFQGWPQLFSSPNVLKVNVSLPEEKPSLRGMVKVDFILCFSILPF